MECGERGLRRCGRARTVGRRARRRRVRTASRRLARGARRMAYRAIDARGSRRPARGVEEAELTGASRVAAAPTGRRARRCVCLRIALGGIRRSVRSPPGVIGSLVGIGPGIGVQVGHRRIAPLARISRRGVRPGSIVAPDLRRYRRVSRLHRRVEVSAVARGSAARRSIGARSGPSVDLASTSDRRLIEKGPSTACAGQADEAHRPANVTRAHARTRRRPGAAPPEAAGFERRAFVHLSDGRSMRAMGQAMMDTPGARSSRSITSSTRWVIWMHGSHRLGRRGRSRAVGRASVLAGGRFA
jgi:hypothetical protein